MDEQEIIKQAMTLLGRRTSAKKKASSRRNAMKPRRKRKKRAKVAETEHQPAVSSETPTVEEAPKINENNPLTTTNRVAKVAFHEEGN